AALIALRLRILAAVLAALADGGAASARRRESRSAGRAAEGLGGWGAEGLADRAPLPAAATQEPVLLIVRLPARFGPSRPP
ncbi:MAG TPA: hypothetical protein GX405_12400, partial [Rhizobiales bacterium]|nr:hypothetical protein [Hyphomicrobiales bacterium]